MKGIRVYLCIIATLFLLATSIASFGIAQAKQAPAAASPQVSMRITEVKVKSAMGTEWENFLKTDLLPAMKKAGVKEFSVWKTAQFGDPDNYFLLSPMQSMAELDKPDPLVKVLGQPGLTALMAKIQRFAASARMLLVAEQPNLTMEPKSGYVLKMGVLVTNIVAPGRETEFEKNSKIIMTAVGKTNAKGFLTNRLSLGGNPNQYWTFVPFDSFADMEKFGPAFTKAMTEAKLAPEAGIVVQREYVVISQIPELSIQPTAPAAK